MRPVIAAVALAIMVMAVAVPVAADHGAVSDAPKAPCSEAPKVVRGPAGPRGPQGPVGPPGTAAEIPWWIIALAVFGAAGGLVGMGAALGHYPAAQPVVINNVVPPHGQPPAAP